MATVNWFSNFNVASKGAAATSVAQSDDYYDHCEVHVSHTDKSR